MNIYTTTTHVVMHWIFFALLVAVCLIVSSSSEDDEGHCYNDGDETKCDDVIKDPDDNPWTEEELADAIDRFVVGSSSTTATDDLMAYLENLNCINGKMKRLEIEVLLPFMDVDKDGSVSTTDIEMLMSWTPLDVVKSTIQYFDFLDSDGDGKWLKDDMKKLFGVRPDDKEDFVESYPKDEISLFNLMDFMYCLDHQFFLVLKHYDGLSNLSSIEFKKRVVSSVETFSKLDQDVSGTLDYGEYLETFESNHGLDSKVVNELKKHAFEGMDKDKNDELDFMEFLRVIPIDLSLASILGITELLNYLDARDINKDSHWTMGEFIFMREEDARYLKRPIPDYRSLVEMFESADKHKNGNLSQKEIVGLYQSDTNATLFADFKLFYDFKKYDFDSDLEISEEEFYVFLYLKEKWLRGSKADLSFFKEWDTNSDGVITFEEYRVLMTGDIDGNGRSKRF